jgi:hypothetical protein
LHIPCQKGHAFYKKSKKSRPRKGDFHANISCSCLLSGGKNTTFFLPATLFDTIAPCCSFSPPFAKLEPD